MKVTDYVAKRVLTGSLGAWGLSLLMAWVFLHHIAGPRQFSVADESEPVELNTSATTLALVVMGLVSGLSGLALLVMGLVGTFWLLVMVVLSPVMGVALRLWAYCRYWVNRRQQARKLKEAELKRNAR